MVTQFGSGSTMRVTLDGPYGSFGSLVKMTALSLPAAGWKNAASPFFQTVAVEGISVNSKIDLQPTPEQAEQLGKQGALLSAANEDGTITVYALGNQPKADITMQATITEVVKL